MVTGSIYDNIGLHLEAYLAEQKYDTINMSNIISITTRLMQFAEAYKSLDGPRKKQVVVTVIKSHLMKVAGEPSPELEAFVTFSLPALIDTSISIARRGIRFTQSREGWSWLWCGCEGSSV